MLSPSILNTNDEEEDLIYSLQQDEYLMRVSDLMHDSVISNNVVDEQ
jgi:hypothetical protein